MGQKDALWQIVFASMKPISCVLISVCKYETHFLCTHQFFGVVAQIQVEAQCNVMASPYVFFVFSDDITVPVGGRKAKEIVQKVRGLLGSAVSHSICKFASAHVC